VGALGDRAPALSVAVRAPTDTVGDRRFGVGHGGCGHGAYPRTVTSLAVALLLVTGVVAVVDWWAVSVGARRAEYVAKPLTMVALIGVALALDPASSSQRWWFVAALALSLAGDVFLMLPSDRFVAGLASFLLAHVAYVVGFLVVSPGEPAPVLTTLLVVLVSVVLWNRLRSGMRTNGQGAYLGPVTAYVVVIAAMVAAAAASGDWVAVLGALLFMISDSIIGETRFVRPWRYERIAIMTTYHLGQVLLVLSLLG
jgi:uncharacterized membrane protein YhhN